MSNKVEKVTVNGMKMYRVGNKLFLTEEEAVSQERRSRANYRALEFGYSEFTEDDFLRKLRDGEIRGILL